VFLHYQYLVKQETQKLCLFTKILYAVLSTETHTHTHTHIRFTTLWTLSRITRVSRYQNQTGFYWSKRLSGSGISWAICKPTPHPRLITISAPHHSVFTGWMPFLPIISCLSFTICFAIQKLSFWWLVSFKSLRLSFCFFPFAKEIILCVLFTLLVLLPCLCQFFFFSNFHTFLLFPYCFSNFLIPPPYFLMPIWAFWQSKCVLCCFHHYIFHLLTMFIYIKVFPLCFHYLIFDHALVFFTSFPPWASIDTLLVQTSYAIFLLY